MKKKEIDNNLNSQKIYQIIKELVHGRISLIEIKRIFKDVSNIILNNPKEQKIMSAYVSLDNYDIVKKELNKEEKENLIICIWSCFYGKFEDENKKIGDIESVEDVIYIRNKYYDKLFSFNREIKKIDRALFSSIFIGIENLIGIIIVSTNNSSLSLVFNNPSETILGMIIETLAIFLFAFGIYKKSRICSVLLSSLLLFEVIIKFTGASPSSGLLFILTYFVLRGMVSIFKYHKYKNNCEIDNDVNDIFSEDRVEVSQPNTYKKNKNPRILIIISMIIIILIGSGIAGPEAGKTKELETKEILRSYEDKIIKEYNETLPVMVDKETRLNSASLSSERNLLYNYTLVNFLKEELNINALKTDVEKNSLNVMKSTVDLEYFRKQNFTFTVVYYDKNNSYLFEIAITPEKYNN